MNDWGGLTLKERRLYNIWINMLQRCENPDRAKYSSYGGRGIAVCEEWHDFPTFIEWAYSNGYGEHLTIDRIDNDGNYEPSNCRWADASEQANNKANNVVIEACGISGNATQWARLLGVSPYTILDWTRTYGEAYAGERIAETARNGGVVKRRIKTVKCSMCGNEFEAPVGTAKYCPDCKPLAKKEKYRKYNKKRNNCGRRVES